MKLGSTKTIGVDDVRRFSVFFNNWLDTAETLDTVTYVVTYVTGSGSAFVDTTSIGNSGINGGVNDVAIFYLHSSGDAENNVFNVEITATTSTGQVKHDHVEFWVVNP